MQRSRYDEYLRLFNARHYDGLLAFFADEFEVVFAGYALRSRAEVKQFYSFLHEYVDERIDITRYVSDGLTIAMEADVVLTGKKTLTPEILKARGLERIVGLQQGQTVTIPQFIHYHLHEGKFTRALCAVYEAPH